MDEQVDVADLPSLVRTERAARGISLRAAAAETGVPFTTLARVEKGHLPDLDNFRLIVNWLGLPPERFFRPIRERKESTPERIAYHLAKDPNLTADAALSISKLVKEMYTALVRRPAPAVHLRAAKTFTPEAASRLGGLLEDMQHALEQRVSSRPN